MAKLREDQNALFYFHVLFINVVSKGFVSFVVAISISFTILFIPFSVVSHSILATLTHSLVFTDLTMLNFL